MSVFEHVDIVEFTDNGKRFKYIVTKPVTYYSERYDKYIEIELGFPSDGATGALDIDSFSWLFHDHICVTGAFSDGSMCNNWQASMILSDILAEEGRWLRSKSWFIATWLFGGGKARKNGMW